MDDLKAFSKAKNNRKILSLNDLCGPFIFLITGSILSLFVFLLEKLHYHFNRVKDSKFPPSSEACTIGNSFGDMDHRTVEIDQPLADVENLQSCLDGTQDKVENVAATIVTNLKIKQGELETEIIEEDEEPQENLATYFF